MLPTASFAPVTLSVALAVPVVAAAERVAVPSVTEPAVKVTLPAGAAAPLAAFTVAVSCVVAVVAIVEGLAETTVVVAIIAAVTVTVVDAVDAEKRPVGAYAAVIVFEPALSALPLTVSGATPETSAAEPSGALPAVKLTEPVGDVVPETAFTVAVSRVVAVGAIVAGLADRVLVVPTVAVSAVQPVTILNASTEPRPVTRS